MSPHLHTPNLSLTLAFTLSALLLAQPVSGPPPPPPGYPTSITTWYVDCTAPAGGDGLSWSTAFASIQTAINNAAHDGHTIIVATATYHENIHFHGKNLTLTSTRPSDPGTLAATVIDGNHNGAVVTFSGTEAQSCYLSGFTIRNGSFERDLYVPRQGGGGISGGTSDNGTQATIQNNIITANTADYAGAGLYQCDGLIQNNVISGNLSAHGGGLNRCDGTIKNNIITDNGWRTLSHTDYGGGLNNCHALIEGNLIAGNMADEDGGGLYHCHGTIQNNVIVGNWAYLHGGGLHRCHGTIQNNIIAANYTCAFGGALSYCLGTIQNNIIVGNDTNIGGGLSFCHGTIHSNLIAGNYAEYGGGLANCEAAILNNTIAYNTICGDPFHEKYGSAMYGCHNHAVIKNCIIWRNEYHGPLFSCNRPTYSCIYPSWPFGGLGNITDDPQFVGDPLQQRTWTDSPAFDPATWQTTLTDASAHWQPNSLTGLTLNPDTAQFQRLQFVVASNTSDQVLVWGNVQQLTAAPVAPGHSYRLYDYRLSDTSPCVGSGQNETWMSDALDLDGHPRIFDGTVDMGAYEYTIHILNITKPSPAAIQLTWNSHSADTYTVQACYDLLSHSWDLLAYVPSQGQTTAWTDTAPAGPIRFYRVKVN